MKTVFLLLMAIVDAAPLSGGLYAVPINPAADQAAPESAPKTVSAQSNRPSGDGGPQSEARASGETQHPRRAAKSRPSSKAGAINSTHHEQVGGHQALAAVGNPANVRSVAPAQSGAVVNHSSPQNEGIYRALPVRPGAAIRPASPFAGTVRHRDPNAAVIGGAVNSNIRSTAAINGTRTNLRGPRN